MTSQQEAVDQITAAATSSIAAYGATRDSEEDAAVAQAVGPLQEQVAGLQAVNASLTAENADLKAQLEAAGNLGRTIIGFSTNANTWNSEMAKLDPLDENLHGRRVYCDLTKGPNYQDATIRAAIAANMMPVLSFKVGNVANAINGTMDTVASQAGQYMASLGVQTRFVVHHEPNNDMTPEQFVKLNLRLQPLLRSAKVRGGCYINGFLLKADKAKFAAFTTDELLAQLTWWGIDAYHAGSMAKPDPINTPASRIQNFLNYAHERGISLPMGIGEYNGFTASAIADAGELILSSPIIEHACMWSSQVSGGDNFYLTGDRLDAFKKTLADPRVLG